MKKTLQTIFSLGLVLVFSACSSDSDDNRVLNMESIQNCRSLLSVVVPGISRELDTILIPCTEITDLHISKKTFKLEYKTSARQLFGRPQDVLPQGAFKYQTCENVLDTIYVNHGKNAITDFIPRAEVPKFPKKDLIQFFAKVPAPAPDKADSIPRPKGSIKDRAQQYAKAHVFDTTSARYASMQQQYAIKLLFDELKKSESKNCGTVLSDTLVLNYDLDVLEGPKEIKLQRSGSCHSDEFRRICCGLSCTMISCLPAPIINISLTTLYQKRYRLVALDDLPVGKTFKWKIRYTDQYSRTGIIDLKTVVE